MIKHIYVIIGLVLLSINQINAQNSSVTKEEKINYPLAIEKYKNERAKLLSESIRLKAQIDSLKSISNELDDKIGAALEEINHLYVKRFGKDRANRIINKQIWKGMTEKMLRASWGEPDKIDKNVEKWGVFTQWYFGDVTFFFRDGKLTDWEEKTK